MFHQLDMEPPKPCEYGRLKRVEPDYELQLHKNGVLLTEAVLFLRYRPIPDNSLFSPLLVAPWEDFKDR